MGSYSGFQSACRTQPIVAAARLSGFAQEPPSQTHGMPQKAPRNIASCFHLSYSELTVFLIILFIISAHLPVRYGLPMLCRHIIFTLAMVYPLRVQIPSLSSDFLVSAASAREAASVRKQRAVSTLHSNHNTNLSVRCSFSYSST